MFELDAAFQDGQLSVYRSGRPVDELSEGMEQAVQDVSDGDTVSTAELREKELDDEEVNEDDPVDAASEDNPSGAENSETETADSNEENDSTNDSDEEKPDSGPNCQYCGKPCKNNAGRASHERHCDESPENSSDDSENGEDSQETVNGDAGDAENRETVSCEHCGKRCDPRGKHRHEQYCDENSANGDSGDAAEDAEKAEANTDDGDAVDRHDVTTPAAIQKAMENPDDLPDQPVPVGVAMQYNAGSYTCQSCNTCLGSDKELTDHVNEEGHRNAYQVNRRGCS